LNRFSGFAGVFHWGLRFPQDFSTVFDGQLAVAKCIFAVLRWAFFGVEKYATIRRFIFVSGRHPLASLRSALKQPLKLTYRCFLIVPHRIFLLRGGNNLCATQLGYAHDFDLLP
jgi:hypothetical protein